MPSLLICCWGMYCCFVLYVNLEYLLFLKLLITSCAVFSLDWCHWPLLLIIAECLAAVLAWLSEDWLYCLDQCMSMRHHVGVGGTGFQGPMLIGKTVIPDNRLSSSNSSGQLLPQKTKEQLAHYVIPASQ